MDCGEADKEIKKDCDTFIYRMGIMGKGEKMPAPPENIMVNRFLFSKHYLEDLIQKNPEWQKDEHTLAFEKIKKIYEEEKDRVKDLSEAQLEKDYFQKIFEIINPHYEVQAETERGGFPDYAFYTDENTRKKAVSNAVQKLDQNLQFIDSIAVGEVKNWNIILDVFGKEEHNKAINPSYQIWWYLQTTKKRWGILSNGHKWRLYRQDKLFDVYYEIDLVKIIEENDIENFKYFYYFFRKEAFMPVDKQEAFLDRVYKGSIDYAKKIGDNLKENVYKAMKVIAEGFFNTPENKLDIKDEKARLEVQKNSMKLLYRLLFLLYAEAKGLLDISNKKYYDTSFDRIKKDVKNKRESLVSGYESGSITLWLELNYLFNLINRGSKDFNIDEKLMFIPPYNGGLFDPSKNLNLDKWDIQDKYLADAIALLAFDDSESNGSGFVDYSTLEIRHLGSIYEGLLEFKLKLANEKIVAISDKKGKVWVSFDEYNKTDKKKKLFTDFDVFDRANPGDLYLTTDKGERKATGSYYTPDYIVDYIVKNTVGPVVEEKWKEAEGKGKSLVEATLSINVLDPAMGSGHFLVGVVDFLGGKLVEAAQKDIEKGLLAPDKEYTIDWAKREVVSHCIYGVDLNDMAVELAKVSLWLTTISSDKPLNFLDHRLKLGNSLIGARLSDTKYYPGAKTKEKEQTMMPSFVSNIFVDKLIGKIAELEKIGDEKLEDIRKKEKVFEEFKQLPEYKKTKSLANVYTSIYFNNEVTPTDSKDSANVYYDLLWSLEYPSNWEPKTHQSWFKKAEEIAEQKKFFHWELEFPEIFFEGGKVRENPGFDAVVGNPPWGEILSEKDKNFLEQIKASVKKGKVDIYTFFVDLSVQLSRGNGNCGVIIPNAFLYNPHTEPLRERILTGTKVKIIYDLSKFIFDDAPDTVPAIVICQKILSKEDLLKNRVKVLQLRSAGGIHAFEQNDNQVEGMLSQELFLQSDSKKINPQLGRPTSFIIDKLNNLSNPLRTMAIASQGIKPYASKDEKAEKEFVSHSPGGSGWYKAVRGRDIGQYCLKWDGEYVKYGEWLYSKPRADFENCESIFYQRLRKASLYPRIVATKANTKEIKPLAACSVLKLLDDNSFNLNGILALLNSNLINTWYKDYDQDVEIKIESVLSIPIRRISFTTPPDKRKSLTDQATSLYIKFLDSHDTKMILAFVEERLSAKPEETDVIHDLLAYLAERMIEMNKEKQAEIKGFTNWLESYVSMKIDDMKQKTKIKEYFKNDWSVFQGALKENKNKISTFDIARREHLEKIKDEFDKSMSKLAPLLKKIKDTDNLIDQIVYKLYGLTEEEIRIVEGK